MGGAGDGAGNQGDGALVTLSDEVILAGGGLITIDTQGNTGGGTTFNSTVDATTAFIEDLTVRGGVITFNSIAGGGTALGVVTFTNSTLVDINGGLTAESITAVTSITAFDSTGGTLTTTGANETSGGSWAVSARGGVRGGRAGARLGRPG